MKIGENYENQDDNSESVSESESDDSSISGEDVSVHGNNFNETISRL